MNNKRLLSLISKCQDNVCSKEELEELEQWYNQLNTGNRAIQDTEAASFSAEMLLDFRKRLGNTATVIPFYRKTYFRIAAAASVILILSAAFFFKFFNNASEDNLAKNIPLLPQEITAPKVSKATITLASGQIVLLDSINTGTLAKQGAVNVVKTGGGQIIYNGTATEAIYNTLFNPRGSKVVSLTLSDGTKAWLNSESSLRYPIAFVGSERNVEITGEAYFEVAKDPTRKFVVAGNGVKTEVLGTHFNVNTYTDENAVKITLLEGAVKISKAGSAEMLKPGQQAQVTAIIKVVDGIDTDAVMAWKNGFFHFGNTSIQELMKQLARWYDIDIVYKGEIPQRAFGGEISREANLSQVLKILNESKVRCRLEGTKLIIE
jgi:ferric-dicitrate binding protein FerR (iron transport regulator)